MSYFNNKKSDELRVDIQYLIKIFDKKKFYRKKEDFNNFIKCKRKEKFNFDNLYEKLTKIINISQLEFNNSIGNIDVHKIFISVPVEKRNKCDICDIQRILMKINNIHNDYVTKKKTSVNHKKCYCKICSSILLYDPHCVCGIYEV